MKILTIVLVLKMIWSPCLRKTINLLLCWGAGVRIGQKSTEVIPFITGG